MLKIKNIAILVLGILIIFWAFPSQGAVTVEQLEKRVSLLLEQIKVLQSQLQELILNQDNSDNNYSATSNSNNSDAQQEDAAISACFEKNLERGMSDSEIISLQSVLKEDKNIYPEGLITGYFGPLTQRALSNFQSKYSISETSNFIGPKTKEKLNQLYCPAQLAPNYSPIKLSVEPTASGQLELKWTDEFFYKYHASGGDYGFLVRVADETCSPDSSFRDIAKIDGDKNLQNYNHTISDLTKSGDYCFYVIANDGFKYYISNKVPVVFWSTNDASSAAPINTQDAEIPSPSNEIILKAPTNLASQIGSGNKIGLFWTNNDDRKNTYNMAMIRYKDCATNTDFTNIGIVDSNISYYQTGFSLNNEMSYCFKVRIFKGALYADSNLVLVEKGLPGPKAPTNLSSENVYSNRIDLVWTDNSVDEKGFIIKRKVNYQDDFAFLADLTPNTTSYKDFEVGPGLIYTYKILAYNDLGENYSSELTANTLLAGNDAPISLKAIVSANYVPSNSPSREHEIARFDISNNQTKGNNSLFVRDIKWAINVANLSEGINHPDIARKFSLYKENISPENKISEFVLACFENINCLKNGTIDFRTDSLSDYHLVSQKNIVSPVEILPAETKTFIIVADTTIPKTNNVPSHWETKFRDDDIFCSDSTGMNISVEGLPVSVTANW